MALTEAQQDIINAIRQPSERSKQKLIGASQLGGCPYHIGVDMAQSLLSPEQASEVVEESGQAAWLGTCMHNWIEANLSLPGAEQEKKVSIFDLEGYGSIGGHIDMVWQNQVWDWKLLGKWKLDKMKLAYRKNKLVIPDTTYRVQLHSYAYGLRQVGYDIERVNIVAFDKMSNNFESIRFFSEVYNEELVLKAIDRTRKIWQHVLAGEVDELPRQEDCYECGTNMKVVF